MRGYGNVQLYDSMYAANITSGLWKPKTNKGIASLCHEHFLAESERRKGGVHLIHIKGHSDQLGNEKADERVQWGKENGPYCRFRLDGTSEGETTSTNQDQRRPLPLSLTQAPPNSYEPPPTAHYNHSPRILAKTDHTKTQHRSQMPQQRQNG